MKKKNTKVWITLIWLPFASLFLITILQIVAQFVFSSVEGVSSTPVFITIISLLVGIFAVLGILLMPLWIIMLVRGMNYNKTIIEPQQQQAQQAQQEVFDTISIK